jgi:hypothetical protein
VWEGNQVWIVMGLVLLWTGFPTALAAVFITLFAPLAASALGIVLRGIGFAFRHEAVRPAAKRLTGALFACSSLLAPFFLGTAVGAVTTGRIAVPSPGISTAGAFIGAVYLVGDASRRGHDDLVPYFGRRAVISGAVTGVLAAVNLALLHGSAPYVFGRLTGVALPLVIISVLAGAAAVTLIVLRRQSAAHRRRALRRRRPRRLGSRPVPVAVSHQPQRGGRGRAQHQPDRRDRRHRHGRRLRGAVLRLPVLAAAARPPPTRCCLGPAAPRRPRPGPDPGAGARGVAPAAADRPDRRGGGRLDPASPAAPRRHRDR